MEIDLEILDMLLANASKTEYWSAKIGEEYQTDGTFSQNNSATGYAYSRCSDTGLLVC